MLPSFVETTTHLPSWWSSWNQPIFVRVYKYEEMHLHLPGWVDHLFFFLQHKPNQLTYTPIFDRLDILFIGKFFFYVFLFSNQNCLVGVGPVRVLVGIWFPFPSVGICLRNHRCGWMGGCVCVRESNWFFVLFPSLSILIKFMKDKLFRHLVFRHTCDNSSSNPNRVSV